MIGKVDPRDHEVTVIGAGISGLLAAYFLDRSGYSVTLLEAQARAGGLIQTQFSDWGLAESGPHSLLVSSEVRELFDELEVPLADLHHSSRARYILRKGELRKFPLTPLEAVRAFCRAYFVLADNKRDPAQISLEEWGKRFLGEPANRYLLTPFVRGIYGARPKDIQVGAAFPKLPIPHGHSLLSYQLARWIRGNRGVSARKRSARPAMMAPREGMGSLVSALDGVLEKRLGARYRKGERVDTLPDTHNTVLAVPATAAAQLLDRADPGLAQVLRAVKYTPLVSVTAFVERASLPTSIHGVGVLIPEVEKRKCLGILFNSSCFPGRVLREGEWVSFTVILGGVSAPEQLDLTDEQIEDLVRGELKDILGLRGRLEHTEIHRWRQAVPQYNGDLRKAWKAARDGWCSKTGHVLFGNYTGQISLRGMIESASELKPH